jgi:hypothetical protein
MQAALALAALGLAVAGCTDDSTGGGATPGVTATTTAPAGGPVASCVTGDWRTTGASGRADAGSISAEIDGGSGIKLNVGQDGATTIDFTGMEPTTFSVDVAGTAVRGQFTYAGTATGTIQTTGGTASPGATAAPEPTATAAAPGVTATAAPGATATPGTGDVTSGTWEPVGTVDWDDIRVTIELTSPIEAKPLDNARLGDYAGDSADQTGNVVDVDPLLGAGEYECRGDTLVLTPDDDGGITWTLARP